MVVVGPGEEWSGGGDTGEWQGGGGEMPPHMSRWNDPKESGDGKTTGHTEAERDYMGTDPRWNQQGRWNPDDRDGDQGRDWKNQNENNSSKDVDYRQEKEQWGQSPKVVEEQRNWDPQEQRGQYGQRGGEEIYRTQGWEQDTDSNTRQKWDQDQKHKETYNDHGYELEGNEQYKTRTIS